MLYVCIQLVDSNFPIGTDGIIGRNLLKHIKCIIDFKTLPISININENSIVTLKQNHLNYYKLEHLPELKKYNHLKKTL